MYRFRLLSSIVFLVILAGVIRIWYVQKTRASMVTDKVTRQSITDTIEASGNIQATAEAPVGTTTTGIISSLLVSNGDHVQEGQTLFTVKSIATDQEKAAAYASYLSAKSLLGSTQATQYAYQSKMFNAWKTYKDIAESSTYENDDGSPKNSERMLPEFHEAKDDWLAAEALYKNQDVVISQAEASVRSAYMAYQATLDSTVTAPMGGTVMNVSQNEGDKVTASTALTSATPIMTIAHLEKLIAVVPFHEEDVLKLQQGMEATVSIDALPEKKFPAHILRLDTKGTKKDGVITYTGYILLDTADPLIKPMMTAIVSLDAIKKEHVLTVPNIAIITEKGESVVHVLNARKAQKVVPVIVGIRGLIRSEVTGNISEGDTVILPSS